MCGGVGYKIKKITEKELKRFYSPELIRRFKTSGRVESFFWNRNASLPVETKDGIQLVLWGNKDENIMLPKTGWAKEESLNAGKWDYLYPEVVDIPVDSGYEKKVWFDFDAGTKGIVVGKGDDKHVYMITRGSSEEYLKETGHGREPLGGKSNYKNFS
jgi:hypothetical protein